MATFVLLAAPVVSSVASLGTAWSIRSTIHTNLGKLMLLLQLANLVIQLIVMVALLRPLFETHIDVDYSTLLARVLTTGLDALLTGGIGALDYSLLQKFAVLHTALTAERLQRIRVFTIVFFILACSGVIIAPFLFLANIPRFTDIYTILVMMYFTWCAFGVAVDLSMNLWVMTSMKKLYLMKHCESSTITSLLRLSVSLATFQFCVDVLCLICAVIAALVPDLFTVTSVIACSFFGFHSCAQVFAFLTVKELTRELAMAQKPDSILNTQSPQTVQIRRLSAGASLVKTIKMDILSLRDSKSTK
ncbi:hypothetical protein HDV03_004776 [Kappamyces sp. JEL0829]|nr:hypothetical protein HDV03_004776 [Kappamyces sp. JEL0829]